MAVRVISMADLREARRQGTHERRVPFLLNDREHFVEFRLVNGEMQALDLAAPVGEMITTEAGRRELLEKVVLDVEIGREEVPLLYGPIYETLTDPNFPRLFEAKWAQHGVVVFMEHMEGEEVKFGHLQAEQGPVARIITYSSGFEYTEEMVKFNETFNMELLNRAFGEGHNALLNHIYLSPIFQHNYKAANKTAAVYVTAEGTPTTKTATGANAPHPMLSLRATLKAGVSDASGKKRPGTVLLVSGQRRNHVAEALQAVTVRGTTFPSLTGIENVIAYDGWEVKVGKKDFSYPGVPDNKAFLVRPRRGFKELIKEDLHIDANDGDLSRLVKAQVVGRSYRGAFAALDENVQEIELPDLS